ncbi:MAG: L-aspartate oxidase [Thermodesulfobacteriota bacterium]|nr:L-aspartate oxidase [Thermodesulfobacteriota bacterium]
MEIQTDFLVIGSGIAGLSFAIKMADLGTVAIVTKKEKIESNTNLAQGGIAAVMDKADKFEYHINDTLTCGAGLSKEDVARFVVTDAPERIKELIEWGVEFTKAKNGSSADYDLGREGGHSRRRILHATDITGQEVERALLEKASSKKNIKFYEDFFAIDLIRKSKVLGRKKSERDQCLGAYVFDVNNNDVYTFRSKFTLLATGGAGKVYLITTNPDISTGDGIAMAYRAGAEIANMEFIQFHPTCLYHPEAKSFLISEAVRGEGGVLKLQNGSTFMEKYHTMESLAPRDIVAKAIDTELKKSGDEYVLLDITHKDKDFLIKRFPNIYNECLEFGIDISSNPIPVVPAAHYLCGGVAVNQFGETNIDGLFACGEVACTGLHGANRLASNSLLEGVVLAHSSFVKISELFPGIKDDSISIPPWDTRGATESDESIVVSHNWDEIRRFMWDYVGIVRSNKRLERAKRRIDLLNREISEYYWNFIISMELLELRNIATVAKLIIQCAMLRKESRGLHYNIDYPEKDDKNWLKDTVISKPSKSS